MVWSISRSLCLSSNSKLNSWTSLSNILSRTTSYESFGMKALIWSLISSTKSSFESRRREGSGVWEFFAAESVSWDFRSLLLLREVSFLRSEWLVMYSWRVMFFGRACTTLFMAFYYRIRGHQMSLIFDIWASLIVSTISCLEILWKRGGQRKGGCCNLLLLWSKQLTATSSLHGKISPYIPHTLLKAIRLIFPPAFTTAKRRSSPSSSPLVNVQKDLKHPLHSAACLLLVE